MKKEERMDIGRRIYEGEMTRYQAAEVYGVSDQTARNYMRLYRDVNQLPAKRGKKSSIKAPSFFYKHVFPKDCWRFRNKHEKNLSSSFHLLLYTDSLYEKLSQQIGHAEDFNSCMAYYFPLKYHYALTILDRKIGISHSNEFSLILWTIILFEVLYSVFLIKHKQTTHTSCDAAAFPYGLTRR